MPQHHVKKGNEKDDRADRVKKISAKGQGVLSKITDDLKALNSSILIISQKMKYLIRNEKILGRNLLVLNKKIKKLQDGSSQGGADLSTIQPVLDEINIKLSSNAEAIARLESQVNNLKENYARKEDVSEIKYVIDSINPLEFVSVNDINQLIDEKISKAKKTSR
ncbi:MAG: hypothetical protein COV47_04305 [Candidatus Diapherotrites archaeon CG11_big_fil_rev_8_21_14_0_20_37_9]|nr:MAG: hypothetical protein COV47_04305 [Candidatus Diapherotrites archaeon CG11_big_fil_rev_8_21_14_0_20_37_9]